jgi:hypothetical protein
MGDPAYDNCRRNADPYSFYGDQCAHETDPKVKAARAEQARQATERQRQADAAAQTAWQAVIDKATQKGYEPHSIRDLFFDGKKFAARDAKVQVSAVYMHIGEMEGLFLSPIDAIQQTNNYLPVLTEDAQRPLRERLVSDYACSHGPGCLVNVGGHMTWCHHLAAALANYPDEPCLHIEVVIQ